ncbi:electron transfer flavoprotein subunit alpha/FixB family protein [Paenibacillus sp. BR2-3]|uniref:electron transfer flavoprotein subunit alpha/FixB family protein n=1 Tax=Paenibacillus sp. BR2-3 TaxID=3048494 RepID=UPI0039777D20
MSVEHLEKQPATSISDYEGILVVVEHRGGTAKKVSWQLLGQGRRMADKLGAPLMALVIGHQVKHLAQEAVVFGADHVYICDNESLNDYRTKPYSRVCLDVFAQAKPEIVLFGATATGRDLAGAIATHLPTGLTADCTALDVEPQPSRILLASRPAFSEKMMATILCKKYRPQMATARPGVFQALQRDDTRTGNVIHVPFHDHYGETATRVIDFITEVNSINLEEADIIIAGGRGLGGPEVFGLLQELADALDGTVGASRAAVDAGWVMHERQIGQTGQTVRPKLIIAAGISGAVQFTVGMQHADMIIAINKDPEAPIFQIAHYGIVGDLFKVLPEIIAEAKKRRGLA